MFRFILLVAAGTACGAVAGDDPAATRDDAAETRVVVSIDDVFLERQAAQAKPGEMFLAYPQAWFFSGGLQQSRHARHAGAIRAATAARDASATTPGESFAAVLQQLGVDAAQANELAASYMPPRGEVVILLVSSQGGDDSACPPCRDSRRDLLSSRSDARDARQLVTVVHEHRIEDAVLETPRSSR